MILVNDAVRKRYGHNFHVECFGSTRYGVDSATSDLDLVIVVKSLFLQRLFRGH